MCFIGCLIFPILLLSYVRLMNYVIKYEDLKRITYQIQRILLYKLRPHDIKGFLLVSNGNKDLSYAPGASAVSQ